MTITLKRKPPLHPNHLHQQNKGDQITTNNTLEETTDKQLIQMAMENNNYTQYTQVLLRIKFQTHLFQLSHI